MKNDKSKLNDSANEARASFTPECWEIEVDGDGAHVRFRDFPYNTVESCPDNELKELNKYATLIAAAPEMYDKLSVALDRLKEKNDGSNRDIGLIQGIETLLAKARGKS